MRAQSLISMRKLTFFEVLSRIQVGDAAADSPWATIYGFKGAFSVKLQEWRGPHLLTVLQEIPKAIKK